MKNPLRLLAAFMLATALARAADTPPAPLLKPTADLKSWQFEETDGAKGAVKVDDGAFALTATKVDYTDWHVQAFQAGLDLGEGKEYVLSFAARSSVKRVAQVYVGINEDDYHAVGLDEVLSLSSEWKSFTFTFKAEGVAAKNNRLGFIVGQETGTVWLKDVTLAPK